MVGAGVAVDNGVGAGVRGCGVGVGVGLGVAGGVGLALSGAVAEGVDGDAVASTPVGGVGDGNTNEVTAAGAAHANAMPSTAVHARRRWALVLTYPSERTRSRRRTVSNG